MARSGGLSVLGAGGSAAAGVALVAVLTNGLSPDAAGTIFATTALFLIATAVVQLGAEVGLVRWLPAQVATGRVVDVGPTLRVALLPVAVLSVTMALAAAVAAPSLAPLVAGEAHAEAVAPQIRVLAAFLPVAAVYNVVLAATRGCRTMRPTVVVESLGRSVLQVGVVAAVRFLDVGPTGVVLAWSVPYLLALAAGGWWLVALLRRLRKNAASAAGPSPDSATVEDAATPAQSLGAQFWRFTAPRAVATVLQTLLKRSDIVLVAALRSPAEAAFYTAATRFVVFGQLGVQALTQALAPQLSALFARGERATAQDLYETVTAWSIMLAWPIYLACAILAPLLLTFFGPGYAGAAAVVVILSLAMLMATASGSVDTVLLMSGRSSLSLINVTIALAVDVGLNLVLIPGMGVVGAAISWAAAIVVRNLLPLLQIKYLLGMSPLGSGTVWVAASAAASLGVVPGGLRLLGAPFRIVIPALVVGALAYVALLWIGRERIRLSALRGTVLRRGAPAELRAVGPVGADAT